LIIAKSSDTSTTKLLLIEEKWQPKAHENALYLACATTEDTTKMGH
jgi:hypothetical protein